MNIAFETKVFFPLCTLTVALNGIAALPAGAEVYKCKNSDGSMAYQEAPCANTGSAGNRINLPDSVGTGKSGDKGKKSVDKAKSPDATSKSMNEAFQRRMDEKDYEGALAFATNDKQKTQARKLAEKKNAKCARLSIKAQRAQSDFNIRGARWKPAADAAESEYRLHCG